MHALIIDDDLSNRKVLNQLLSMEGFTVTQLPNANELETVLENIDEVTLIFLDLEMPGISGYQAFEIVNSKTRFRNVPVVAYSVHRNELANARSLGFHSFLSKPLNLDQFPEQLNRILRGEHIWTL